MYLQGVLSFIHLQPPVWNGLLNEWQPQFSPKEDIWFFLVFIISAVSVLLGCLKKVFSKRLSEKVFTQSLMAYATVEAVWTGLLLCALVETHPL